MLIGCCQCEGGYTPPPPPPSESIPPSESLPSESLPSHSASSEGPPPEVDYTCNVCDGGISPIRFKVAYSPGGDGFPCAPNTPLGMIIPDHTLSRALYTGEFTLHKRSACSWSTDEKAVLFLATGDTFTSPLKKRFSLFIGRNSGGFAVAQLNVFFMYVKVGGTYDSFLSTYGPPPACGNANFAANGGGDVSQPSSVTYRGTFPTANLDCLTAMNLSLSSITWGSSSPGSLGYVYNLAFGGISMNNLVVAGSGFPGSVTVAAT